MAAFSPLRRIDGYLPIEDHGLIGDGTTAALVGRDGAISWMCAPRFDSPPVFCAILDAKRGGAFTVAPEGLSESRQFYETDTGVLVTEMRCAAGLVRVTDALTLRAGADLSEDAPAGRGELLRSIQVLDGRIRLRVAIEPRGGAHAEPRGDGLGFRYPARSDLDLHLNATRADVLTGNDCMVELGPGGHMDLVLRWGKSIPGHFAHSSADRLAATLDAWHRWLRQLVYEGPEEPMVRRSAITLKMLDHTPNGAMVAAPTSSLPEAIGGPRNWDYRYTWIRDAAFSVYALRRIGFTIEAARFLGWVLDAIERGGQPRVLYTLDGMQPEAEREDGDLEGYRRSAPVRWGNAAAEQWQHDICGEVLDCVHQWIAHGGTVNDELWTKLRTFVDRACSEWRAPDHGIWEVRSSGRVFTYSAALCQVAVDRGARMAARFRLPADDCAAWRAASEKIRAAILEDAWDDNLQSLTEHLGGGGLDASLLSLPLRRVIPADHPRMMATAAAIGTHLSAGKGLLYRYIPEISPDGLPGHEGAFLLCSFWMVDNLAKQRKLKEACDLYRSLCARAGPLGLLPEEIDPGSGAFLGNYPQAFSHIGVISSGVNLARMLNQEGYR